jgi:uncharacterized membrane protein
VHYLFIAVASLNVLLAMTMLFYGLRYRSYTGFGYWTAGMGALAASNILHALRGFIPDIIPVVLGNTLFPFAILWVYKGALRFLGLPDMSRLWYALPAATLAACLAFSQASGEPGQRLLWFALADSIPLLLTARILLKRRAVERLVFYPIIAFELIAIILLLLSRSVWFLFIPSFSFFMDSPFQFFFFVAALLLEAMVAISFIMLNSERLHCELNAAQDELTAKMAELEQSMSEAKVLRGLLPICSGCKKIRDENGAWIRLESYIHARSELRFSRGICPECSRKSHASGSADGS